MTSSGLGGTCHLGSGKCQLSNTPEAAHMGLAGNVCSCAPYCKTAVMKKRGEPQGNAERQFWELRNKMKEHRQYFTREIETLKKNQTISEVNKGDEEFSGKNWKLSRLYGGEN